MNERVSAAGATSAERMQRYSAAAHTWRLAPLTVFSLIRISYEWSSRAPLRGRESVALLYFTTEDIAHNTVQKEHTYSCTAAGQALL